MLWLERMDNKWVFIFGGNGEIVCAIKNTHRTKLGFCSKLNIARFEALSETEKLKALEYVERFSGGNK